MLCWILEYSNHCSYTYEAGVQKVGTAGTGQTTFGWTKLDF